MKINITKILAPAFLLGTLMFSTSAMAQSPNYKYNHDRGNYNHQYDSYRASYLTQKKTLIERFQNQRERIADGQRDGSLTWREASFLKNKLSSLEQELASTGRAGYITPQQYKHFDFELDKMNQVIFKAKHNGINQHNNRQGYRRF